MTILTREQIDSLASDTDDGFNLTLNEQDSLCATARAYHDLRDAVLALCINGGVRLNGEERLFAESALREVVARVEGDES